MECDKFESLIIDELYDELDEVTSAAVKRHAAGCARCGALLSGFRATRKVAVLPIEEPSADLEDRILSAVREQQKVLPFRARLSTALSRAGAWAMRPQTAMAAVLILVIGTSLVMVQNKKSMAPASDMRANAEGAPMVAAASPTATAAASAYGLEGREAAFAHGVVERDLPAAPGHVATLSSSLLAENQKVPSAIPADEEPLAKKSEISNAGSIAGGPKPRALALADDKDTVADGRAAASAGGGGTGGSGNASWNADNSLQAANEEKNKSGCTSQVIQQYKEVSQRANGQEAANKANLALARCSRQNGDTEQARAYYSRLIPVQGYSQTAQQELDQISPATAQAHRAPAPVATAPATTTQAPTKKADGY